MYFKSLQYLLTALLLLTTLVMQSQPSVNSKDMVRQELNELLQLLPNEALEYVVNLEAILKKQLASNFSRDEITFYLLDTAMVYSVSENPKRFTYTYDEEGKQIIEMQKRFVNEQWVNVAFENINYNDFGLPEEITNKQWEGGAWVNETRYNLIYDSDGLLETETVEQWNNDSWLYTTRIHYTWNNSGLIAAVFTEQYQNDDWVSYSNELYVRDEFGNLLELVYQEWDGDSWQNQARLLNSYTNAALNDSSFFMDWVDNNWENVYLEAKSYNDIQQIIENEGLFFLDNEWVSSQLFTYEYNESGLLETSIEEMYDEGWLPYEKMTMIYNEWGSVQSILSEIWSEEAWGNNLLKNSTFDEDGNAGTVQVYSWANDSWQQLVDEPITLAYNYGIDKRLFSGYRVSAAYQSILVDVAEINHQASFSVFPNPASNNLTIEHKTYNDGLESHLVQIFDAQGKLIASEIIENSAQQIKLDISSLSSGQYYISIGSKKSVESQKIVIIK